jgi:beta-lactam-binding protein with PASTA domain
VKARPDPATLDPDREPRVAALIREWIGVAEPPENATIGANLRYTEWGVKVGSVPGGRIAARAKPDAAGRTPEAYCWSIRASLDSVDHCTLEDYVLSKLAGGTILHCKGRYKLQAQVSVGDYRDQPADAARRQVLMSGFKVELTLGSVAESLDKAHTIESQEPAPGRHLPLESTVSLSVRRRPKTVPDVMALPAEDAVSRIEEAGLRAEVSIEGAAANQDEVSRVRRQDPAPNTVIRGGAVVRLFVLGPVSEGRTVPDCRRLLLAQALGRLRQKGLKGQPAIEDPAPLPEQVGEVRRQEPLPGTEAARDMVVRLYAYGPVRNVRSVPDCRHMPLAEALELLRRAGLAGRPAIAGAAPVQARVGRVWTQDPTPDAEVFPNAAVRLYVYGPVRTAARVPECIGVTSQEASARLREVGLGAVVRTSGAAPAERTTGLVWKQVPKANAEIVPGSSVTLFAYGPPARKNPASPER